MTKEEIREIQRDFRLLINQQDDLPADVINGYHQQLSELIAEIEKLENELKLANGHIAILSKDLENRGI